ncbi:hypothetical protein TrRE_jg4420 [Triparma retinervis]|uniref:N6-adenine methyltransferase n=1 Tax=Triparma retinervis TaxID=2557542 RepID=A0A9W7A2P2_9STRA|nr:hypothetical protein TrRE_jg4420 [Triparma retinervis]
MDISEEEMLAELRAISNKSSSSRFDTFEKKVVKTTADNGTTTSKNGIEFLKGNPEDPALNQYWYSQGTVEALANECDRIIGERGSDFKVAFLSTPSIYFALDEKKRASSYVFDYDRKWDDDRGFVFYDFNKPEEFEVEGLKGTFDMVVIDPPFITREVWEKYTESAMWLLKEKPGWGKGGGMVIGTTLQENAGFLDELLGCKPQAFKPSIPNLPYQYNSYANFDGAVYLGVANPEISE